MGEKIKVLLIKPLEPPQLIEIEDTLEQLRGLVGGSLQAVFPWDDPVALVCDDEGKCKGYEPNRLLVNAEGEPYDVLVGNFFITGIGAENFISLSDELITKYTDKFRFPEIFISAPGKHVLWCRIGSEENPKMIL